MGPIFICLDHGKELCSPRANVSLCGFTCHPRTLKQKQLNNMNPPSRFQLVVNIYYFIISSSGLLQSTSFFYFIFYFILMITMLICTHFWKWGTNGKQLSSWHAFPSHTEPSQPRSLIATAITQTSITLSWEKPHYPNGEIVHYIVCIPSTVFYCFYNPLKHCQNNTNSHRSRGGWRPKCRFKRDIYLDAVLHLEIKLY